MKIRSLIVILLAASIVACHESESNLDATNILDGEVVDYFYQTFTMSADESKDTYHPYVVQNRLHAQDETERLLPKELQGLFFLDGAPFPDKTLSLKHVKPMDENANRIRWTVPYKTTFAWLNNGKGHKVFAKAKKQDMYYELEWRDCTDEVLADMEKQYALFNVKEKPVRCTAADRKFAVINTYAVYDDEVMAIPEDLMYFDTYLIPKNDERDYYIWHRRSKVCNNNEGSSVKGLCSLLRKSAGRDTGDGYSRYQFTQVVNPDGSKTSAYNSKLIPNVMAGGVGEVDNIFLVCDPSETIGDEACIDGTETLPAIKDRDIDLVIVDKEELSFFEKIVKNRKTGQWIISVALDLADVFNDHD